MNQPTQQGLVIPKERVLGGILPVVVVEAITKDPWFITKPIWPEDIATSQKPTVLHTDCVVDICINTLTRSASSQACT